MRSLPVVSAGVPHFWPNDRDPDLAAHVGKGWRPTPFTTFICKIHSLCNLDCDYCFIYHMADSSWRGRPKRMELAIAAIVAQRIGAHAKDHELERVQISLHGGEPLLVGIDHLRSLVETFRSVLSHVPDVRINIQTNGTLIDEGWAQFFASAGIKVGFSLDGGKAANDRHRLTRSGTSSYDDVAAAMRLLQQPRFRACYGGVLCVIDVANDPLSVYRDLVSVEAPAIDFLLPHGNWTTPPPNKTPGDNRTPYADWLIPIFDAWYGERPKRTSIRTFEEIIHLVLGGRTSLESLGLGSVNLVVVETDGSIEAVDNLKSTYDGAASTGLSLIDHDFDTALTHPAIVARQVGLAALHQRCVACSLRRICGGGYYPHRFDARNGFKNPSVFCEDLICLIRHIQARVGTDLASCLPICAPKP